MGRPKGSKNKDKAAKVLFGAIPTQEEWEQQWQNQKEKAQLPVTSAVKPSKSASRKKIVTTIEEPSETEDSSSGKDCVSAVTTLRVIKGFINIQKNPRGGYYTGGDIHDTLELAKKFSTKNTVSSVYIAFEVDL